MRRSVLIGTCVVLAFAGGASALAGARHAPPAMVVCPQHPGFTTCCGPPVEAPDLPICCPLPTTVGCPPSLSISASPNPLTAGGQVTISGQMFGGSGAGEQIVLWQRLAGGHWRRAGQASTDATGSYSITLARGKVMTNRDWYASGGGIDSSMVNEGVAAVVTLAASRTAHSATVSGRVTPAHGGERVLLQRLVRGGWVTIARPRLTRSSRFAVRYPYAPKVRASLRAVLPADARNIRSQSRVLTAVVFPVVVAK